MEKLLNDFGYSSEKIPLICFPFAGGYSVAYRPLHAALQGYSRVIAVEPPGHGTNRMGPVESLEEMVDMYLCELRPFLHRPFALFGHSLGGLVVYRLTQKLERKGIFPRTAIISAARPPHVRFSKASSLCDKEFLDYIVRIGGIPSELLQHREMLSFFLPAFRADFKALETFEHEDSTILQSPIHIFNADDDESCVETESEWNSWAFNIQFHRFSGGHMYLLSETGIVAAAIQSILAGKMDESEADRLLVGVN